jgi:hypothetical protein
MLSGKYVAPMGLLHIIIFFLPTCRPSGTYKNGVAMNKEGQLSCPSLSGMSFLISAIILQLLID